MPDNEIPATQSEPGAAPAEFDFAQPTKESPRLKRRSLKTKSRGLIKPVANLTTARELEREAPPLPDEEPKPLPPQTKKSSESKSQATPSAPPRTLPSVATAEAKPTTTTPAYKSTVTPSNPTTTSPHGTRPATLYYSSQPRQEETPSPMKTTPTATPAASNPASASVTRPNPTATRPATTVDYRANVERQSREQKSVGNILSILVYSLIGCFVLSVGLASYGAYIISVQLHQQSVTVSDLDQRYAAANKDLTAKLEVTQGTLVQADAQIARQQDLITKQQEELNRLIAATNDNTTALKQEKAARASETASLRARVRDLENRGPSTQRY